MSLHVRFPRVQFQIPNSFSFLVTLEWKFKQWYQIYTLGIKHTVQITDTEKTDYEQ